MQMKWIRVDGNSQLCWRGTRFTQRVAEVLNLKPRGSREIKDVGRSANERK